MSATRLDLSCIIHAGDAARNKSNRGLVEDMHFGLELLISSGFGWMYAFTGWLCGIKTADENAGQTPSTDQVRPCNL